jgi:Fe-S cluster assembly protein SufD
MSQLLKERDHYLSSYENFERRRASESAAIRQLRSEAIARFAEIGFPTTHEEDWKYTNVAPVVRPPYKLVDRRNLSAPKEIGGFDLAAVARLIVVFVNGHYSPELSRLAALPIGVEVRSIAELLNAPATIESSLGRYANCRGQAFVALNTAFMEDGAYIRLRSGTVMKEPIHVVFVATADGEPFISHPRNLIVAEEGAQANILDTYIALREGVYFTNSVTEIVAAANSLVTHSKLQCEAQGAFHVATVQAQVGREAGFSSHSISLGGSLARNDINAQLNGEGVDCIFNGLYLTAGNQHIDNHTRIDHAKPNCVSREVYKGVLGGKSRGVFNGKICVQAEAQNSDAKQTNKNLLLSADATINTKPQLEIFADNVKCSHGSTVGQLDPDALFYLRSRGIAFEAARASLTAAFAREIISQLAVPALRAMVEEMVMASLAASLPGNGDRL